jgi:hypothetical protein
MEGCHDLPFRPSGKNDVDDGEYGAMKEGY